jgi:hypothetical protein
MCDSSDEAQRGLIAFLVEGTAMVVDMHPQIWLEPVPGTVPAMVVVLVLTDHEARMTYHMEVVNNGKSGFSKISQSGTVNALANAPTPLTKVAMSSQPADDCNVVVFMREGNADRGTFRFNCPR